MKWFTTAEFIKAMTTSMYPNNAFIVIITETMQEADEINRRIPSEMKNIRVKAFKVNAQLHGIRFGSNRPIIVIEKYRSWNEDIAKWRFEVLKRIGNKDTLYI